MEPRARQTPNSHHPPPSATQLMSPRGLGAIPTSWGLRGPGGRPVQEQSSAARARSKGPRGQSTGTCRCPHAYQRLPRVMRGSDGRGGGGWGRWEQHLRAHWHSAANTALLRGTHEYLPRKCSCAAFLGNWTGTGRRKRPLQGKPRERPRQQKERLHTVEQRGQAPSLERREGRASGRGGGARA